MRLQTEYANRHKIQDTVLAVYEGFYAFTDRSAFLFVHTGLRPRAHKFCANCMLPGVAVDIFRVGPAALTQVSHGHIAADENLVPAVRALARNKYATLLSVPSRQEAEIMVWRSFVVTAELDANEAWQDMTRALTLESMANGWTSDQLASRQMGMCAVNFAPYFQCYYQQLVLLLTGRKFVDLGAGVE